MMPRTDSMGQVEYFENTAKNSAHDASGAKSPGHAQARPDAGREPEDGVAIGYSGPGRTRRPRIPADVGDPVGQGDRRPRPGRTRPDDDRPPRGTRPGLARCRPGASPAVAARRSPGRGDDRGPGGRADPAAGTGPARR